MIRTWFFIVFLVFSQMLYAQTETQKQTPALQSDWGFDGQFMVSTDGKYTFANFGGPSMSLNVKKLRFSVGMYPSVRYYDATGRPDILPSLGFGFMFNYKKLVLGVPFYYINEENKVVASFGIGIKLTQKK